ncbi:MAG: glycosyltransferase, partial [Candidatus Aenigmatarchaeota archaeon]
LNAPITSNYLGFLEASDADILHIHMQNPFHVFLALFSSAIRKKKLVITYHSDIYGKPFGFLADFLNELLLSKADAILPTSGNYVRTSSVLKKFKKRITVVPIGINLDKFKMTKKMKLEAEAIKKRFSLRKGKTLLFVGRLIPYKGVEYLLEAMPEILKRDPDVKLVVIGSGKLEKKLEAMTKTLGLRSRVVFLGSVKNIAAYYHACDVFVLPSVNRAEAFGIVQLEAMACEKPVISTEIGSGTSFVNKNGESGFVVRPKSREALSNAILKLLKNAPLRKRMGRNGYRRVKRLFTIKKMAESVLEVYKKL